MLIIAQIMSVQCLYYFTMCIWITVLSYIVGTSRSLDVIFEFKVRVLSVVQLFDLCYNSIFPYLKIHIVKFDFQEESLGQIC